MLEHEAERWLSIQKDLGRTQNTLLAYRRSLESYGSFCLTLQRPVYEATKEDVALFVRSMTRFSSSCEQEDEKRAVRDGQRHNPATADGREALLRSPNRGRPSGR